MGTPSSYLPLTHKSGSDEQRVQVDIGSTGFALGREFRTFVRLNHTSATTIYLRLIAPINFNLLRQKLTLVSGAAEATAWLGATPSSFVGATVPIIGRNRQIGREGYPTEADPPYVAQLTFEKASSGTFSGGTEVDVLQVNSGTNQGSNSSSNVDSESDVRGLPPDTYWLKIGPIAGITNTDQVIGTYELVFEERPADL
ncbi:hypothetical protein CJ97_gp28 [Ralstonia phage RSB2]|uniref:Uncharacterized protein ORF28 n=1 Tax=Ralstonia phage RSB2 TaxID=913183 RepID=E5RV08_9CAUD|nr:hypothetical protein CJ97_gp28 [Ralstonia phage RSB2]BAJ51816.1 hypothetical protein [Ralstonia phage RSB2]